MAGRKPGGAGRWGPDTNKHSAGRKPGGAGRWGSSPYHRRMDVTVVGSGPNGLAAAVICARAGLSVQVLEAQPTFGGGARTAADPEYPGVTHDICSAVHPLGLASPFFTEFDLAARGVQLTAPEISYANPLEHRPAAIAYRDLDRTCAELEHGASWRRLLGPLAADSRSVVKFLLGDKRSVPSGIATVVRLGLRIAEQAGPAWNATLSGDDARALYTGVAAHTISRLPSVTSAGAGMMLATLGHTVGWPIPVGGSQAITDALIAECRRHLAGYKTPRQVVVVDELPRSTIGKVLRGKVRDDLLARVAG